MTRLLDLLLGDRLDRQTSQYLTDLSNASRETLRRNANQLLASFERASGAKIRLGLTDWQANVDVPLMELVRACGLITGSMGSGKTMLALVIIQALIDVIVEMLIEHDRADLGFGVLDAKGELFLGALWLLKNRLEQLARTHPNAAKALRRRITICDFSSRDPITPYNILARWNGADPEFFALSRADLVMDLLETDKLSLGAVSVMQRLFMLLSEFALPITWVSDVIRNASLRHQLLVESKNRMLSHYFTYHFASVPKSTLAAIERRMEALTASDSIRLALSGTSAPDFRETQDEGRIALINCFGENIPRSVRHLLHGVALSDIHHSVFARRNKGKPFLWGLDESQKFFISERLKDNMHDLLTMSRSFNTFFLLLTQNMTTAVSDARMLKVLYTNIRWSVSMRGDPADCQFLEPALPVTGRKLKPRISPFEEPTFYTEREERRLLLDNISQLPDRTGYFWAKSRNTQAIKIRTADLVIPQGADLEASTEAIRRDITVGWRISRKAYERQVAERDQRWKEPTKDLEQSLTEVYRQQRG